VDWNLKQSGKGGVPLIRSNLEMAKRGRSYTYYHKDRSYEKQTSETGKDRGNVGSVFRTCDS